MKKLTLLIFTLTISALVFTNCKKVEEVVKTEKADVKNTTAVTNTQPKSSKIGEKVLIAADAIPKPFESGTSNNPPTNIEPPAGAKPSVPEGFEVSVFTEGDYTYPRLMIEAPNGDL